MGNRRNAKAPPFVMIKKELLRSPEWKELSKPTKLVYIYLRAKFNGSNADDLRLPYTEVKQYLGLSSATTTKSFKELANKEWVERTQYGGLHRFSTSYKLIGKWGRLPY